MQDLAKRRFLQWSIAATAAATLGGPFTVVHVIDKVILPAA